MTISDIKIYLKKHPFLVFKYGSEFYSLKRTRSLLCPQYSLIATDALPQHRKSLEELCDHVFICKNTLLRDAVKDFEVPDQNDPSWKTYEAVRHVAIIHGNEIHFLFQGKSYWIAHTSDKLSHLSDDSGNTQIFKSSRDLFEGARINGSPLKEIWGDVFVDAC